MLSFLNPQQEKDALTLEKERLNKHLATLQRQSQELEKRLHRKFPQEAPQQPKPTPKPERIARFIPDQELPLPTRQKNTPPLKPDLLKHQKRRTRNHVITLAIIALILTILVIRTLF